MVDWKDPATQIRQLNTLGRFFHLIAGAYFCEYLASLRYDIRLLFKDKGGARWVKIVYLVCRNSFLAACILPLLGVDLTHEFNCGIWAKCTLIFLSLSIPLASTLIGMRVIAIWFRDVWITILVITSILAVYGTSIYNMTKVTGEWNPSSKTCVISDASVALAGVISNAACDIILMLLMMLGLFRNRPVRKGGVWRVLWDQNLFWVALVAFTEFPTAVILGLNLNPVVDLIPAVPEAFILVIGATRMYRSLNNYINDDDSSIIRSRQSWKVWNISGAAAAR